MIKSKLQYIPIVLGILIFLAFSPVVSFVFNGISILGMLIGGAVTLCGLGAGMIREKLKTRWGKIITAITAVLVAAVLVWALICTVLMICSASADTDESNTVIVLGCQIKEDKPSKMLRQRLDKAIEYLADHDDAVCILSGGQGDDEIVPESEAMYNYMLEKGVDPSRLYTEDRSHNTQENMKYSAEIINEERLDKNVVVITNAFHQYRASVYAKEAGLCAYALNCKTNIGVLPTYWLRELFAILKMNIVLN